MLLLVLEQKACTSKYEEIKQQAREPERQRRYYYSQNKDKVSLSAKKKEQSLRVIYY